MADFNEEIEQMQAESLKQLEKNIDAQMSFLGSMAENEIISDLRSTDVNMLTPIEAMNILYRLKAKAESL